MSTGRGRGTVYHLKGLGLPHPNDVFGKAASSPLNGDSSPLNGGSSPLNGGSSSDLAAGSPLNGGSYPDLAASSPGLHSSRDMHGRLLSSHLQHPIIDDVKCLAPDFRAQMEQLAAIPRIKRKVDRETMKRVILALCSNQYVTLDCIAVFVCRNAKSMQSQFLTPMVRDERTLQWAFPTTPNHPQQAYIAAQMMPNDQGKEKSE